MEFNVLGCSFVSFPAKLIAARACAAKRDAKSDASNLNKKKGDGFAIMTGLKFNGRKLLDLLS